jgi:hypothetical protein
MSKNFIVASSGALNPLLFNSNALHFLTELTIVCSPMGFTTLMHFGSELVYTYSKVTM